MKNHRVTGINFKNPDLIVKDGENEFHTFFLEEKSINTNFERFLKQKNFYYRPRHLSWQRSFNANGRSVTQMIFAIKRG